MDPRATADHLRARSAARAEAAARQTIELRTQVVEVVQTHLPAAGRAWLIGSLAWGGFGTRSDIDLVVSGLEEDDETRLEWALIRSTDRAIELLRLRDLPPSFQERVLQEGLAIARTEATHAPGN